MLFNDMDILSALKSGQSADELASNFTKCLNAAMEQIRLEEEKARKEKERKEAERKAAEQKIDDFHHILVSLNVFFKEFYPELSDPDLEDRGFASDCLEILEETLKAAKTTFPLFGGKALFDPVKKIPKEKEKEKEDALTKFLRENKLL